VIPVCAGCAGELSPLRGSSFVPAAPADKVGPAGRLRCSFRAVLSLLRRLRRSSHTMTNRSQGTALFRRATNELEGMAPTTPPLQPVRS
jgi:hypothetical protein